jgi:hypothetical protein
MVFLIQNSQNRDSIEGKNEGRAQAVLALRRASAEAKQKLRVIERDG